MSADDCLGESGPCLELAETKGSGRQKEKQEIHCVRTEESEDINVC